MTIQKNAFFSEIGYENHKQEKAALMKDHFIFNPTWMGTVRILVQHLHQPSHSVKSHILRNFFLFIPIATTCQGRTPQRLLTIINTCEFSLCISGKQAMLQTKFSTQLALEAYFAIPLRIPGQSDGVQTLAFKSLWITIPETDTLVL